MQTYAILFAKKDIIFPFCRMFAASSAFPSRFPPSSPARSENSALLRSLPPDNIRLLFALELHGQTETVSIIINI